MKHCKVYGCPFNDGLYCRIPPGTTLNTTDTRCNQRTTLVKQRRKKADKQGHAHKGVLTTKQLMSILTE